MVKDCLVKGAESVGYLCRQKINPPCVFYENEFWEYISDINVKVQKIKF